MESNEAPSSTPSTSIVPGELYVVRDGAMVPLVPARSPEPEQLLTIVDSLQAVGTSMLALGEWSHDAPDRPLRLAIDESGTLSAVVLLGNDEPKELERTAKLVEWLRGLSLRDVVKMHGSADELLDLLLANNPDELHLSLGEGRRLHAVAFHAFARSSELVALGADIHLTEIELFTDAAGGELLVRQLADDRVRDEAKLAAPPDDEHRAAQSNGDEVRTIDDGEHADTAAAFSAEVTDQAEDTDDMPDNEAASTAGVAAAAGTSSSLAPPPRLAASIDTDDSPLDLNVAFEPGNTIRTVDLLQHLGASDTPELLDDGTIATEHHVLLTEVLSETVVLESRGHYHRTVPDELTTHFQSWYDGDLASVTFHLFVRSALRPGESTYIGQLKPTAWEHRADAQRLLFRIVPRISSDLWHMLTNESLPPLPDPVEAVGADGAIDLRDRGRRRLGSLRR